MTQPKHMSWLESLTNIGIGYTINIFANFIILPWFGYVVTLKKNLLMGLCFTGVSLIRLYCIRRWFDKKNRKGEEQ